MEQFFFATDFDDSDNWDDASQQLLGHVSEAARESNRFLGVSASYFNLHALALSMLSEIHYIMLESFAFDSGCRG